MGFSPRTPPNLKNTEDMIAKIEIMNEKHVGWSRNSYWRGMVLEEYRACMVCDGDDLYRWDDDHPELCSCTDMDGIGQYIVPNFSGGPSIFCSYS